LKIYLRHILFFTLFPLCVFSQKIKVTELTSSKNSDSSYYEAIVFNPNHIWFLGKHGIITELKNNKLSHIIIPENKGVNILSAAKIDSINYILTADKGVIYFYNSHTNVWRCKELKGYYNRCLYTVLVLNEKEILICGGSSKVAIAKKDIPHGFILKSNDGGETWTKGFSAPFKMAWRIKKGESNTVFVNLYRPNYSMLVCSKDNGKTWKKSKIKTKGLIHDFYIDDSDTILVGGKGFKKPMSARVIINNKQDDNINANFIWETKYYNNTVWIATGNSMVAFKKKENEHWNIIKLSSVDFKNIYKIISADVHTLYAFGSGQHIYQLKIIEE